MPKTDKDVANYISHLAAGENGAADLKDRFAEIFGKAFTEAFFSKMQAAITEEDDGE